MGRMTYNALQPPFPEHKPEDQPATTGLHHDSHVFLVNSSEGSLRKDLPRTELVRTTTSPDMRSSAHRGSWFFELNPYEEVPSVGTRQIT